MKAENLFNQSKFDLYAAYLKSTGLSDASLKRKLSSLANFQRYLVKKNLIQNPSIQNPPYPPLKMEGFKPQKKSVLDLLFQGRKGPFREGGFKDKGILTYLLIASLLIISSAIGYGFYRQSIKQAKSGFAYSTASNPVYANRFLSFQGRLTDSSGNPITSSVSIRFDLFNTEAVGTGTSLYTSATGNSQVVVPDENGIFSVTIGKTHGTEIPNSVFTENPAVYLQITAGSETMSPRQPIATVAYAINAETLQGLPPSASGTKDTVLVVDSLGNLNLGETSPTIKSTSGTLGIEGQAILIKATDGSGGNIEINPDANGIIKLTTEGSGSTAVNGFIDATNANLSTGNLYSATIRNDNRGYNFLDFRNYDVGTTNLSTKFSIDASGNTFIGGILSPTTISIGNTILTSSAYELNLLDGTLATAGSLIYGNGSNLVNTSVGTSGQVLMSNGSSSPFWVNSDTVGKTYTASVGITQVGNDFRLNLGYSPTWTALHTFTNGIGVSGTANLSGNLNIGGTLTLAQGANNNYVLTSDSSGNARWAAASGGSTYTADNGLTLSGSTFKLGGTLTQDTTIDTSSFSLSLKQSGTAPVLKLLNADGSTNSEFRTDATSLYNNFIGVGVGQSNTTGNSNVALGYGNLANNDSGSYNVAVGQGALWSNTSGWQNTAVGYIALQNNTTGLDNSAFGSTALYSIVDGNDNSAFGVLAGRYLADGITDNTSSDYSLYFGGNTKSGDTSGDAQNEIVIGYNAIGNGSNSVVLGNDSITTTTLQGNVGIGTTNPSYKLDVNGNGKINNIYLSQGLVNSNSTDLTLIGGGASNTRNEMILGNNIGGITLNAMTGSGAQNILLDARSNGGFILLNGGNVGLGTTNPTSKLTVIGDANISTNLTVGGTFVSVGSTNLVTNLNADLLDGQHSTYYLNIGQTGSLPYVNNTTDTTLTRSGSGPYTLGLNLGSTNTWTGAQTFNANTYFPGSGIWNTSGYVGIGTTNPISKLQVLGDITPGANLTYDLGSSALRWNNTWTNVLNIGASTWSLQSPDNSRLSFFNNTSGGTETVTFLKNGNVGIGTTNPTYKLTIGGASSTIHNTSGDITIDAASTNVSFSSGNLINVNNGYFAGEIGIGTTTPLAPLHVSTTISASVGGQTISSLSGLFTGSLAAPRYYDSDNSLYYVDPAVSDTNYSSLNLATQGSIKFNINSANLPNTYIGAYAASRIQGFTNGLSLDVGTTASIGVGNTVVWNNNLFLATSGNVGIGTTTPTHKLSVGGASSLISNDSGDITFNAASNNISFAGDNLINVNNAYFAGNVGIGTTNPTSSLTVGSGASIQYAPNLTYNSPANLSLFASGQSLTFGLGNASPYAAWLQSSSYTNTSLPLALNPLGGNVGIGTTNPAYKLDVSGSGNFTSLFVNGVAVGAGSGNYWTAATGGIQYGSNVGIGTATPSSKLHVVGSGLFTGSLSVGTNLSIGGTLTISQGAQNGYVLTSDASGNAYWAASAGVGTTYAATNGLTLASGKFGLGGLLTQNTDIGFSGFSLTFSDGGTTFASFSNSGNTFYNPTTFTSAGDVSMAYDLNFTNSSGSNINTAGPLSINTGEIFGSSNLTLQTYNAGKIILNSSNLYNDGTNFGIGTTAPTYKLDVTGTGRFTSNVNVGGTFTLSQGAQNGYILASDASGNARWILNTGTTYVAGVGLTLSSSNVFSLNLGSTNTWTAVQNLSAGATISNLSIGGTFVSVGSTNLVTNLNANYLGGIASTGFLQVGSTGSFISTLTNGVGVSIVGTGIGRTINVDYDTSKLSLTGNKLTLNLGSTNTWTAIQNLSAGATISTLSTTGNASIGGTLSVTGRGAFTNNVSVGGTLTLTQGAGNNYLLVSDAGGNSRWANPTTLGLGTTYSAGSGLTMTNEVIRLGGLLSQNTDIGFSGFNLTFSDSGSTLASFNSVNNTFYNPTTFASAGDVSMAYDLNFTNSTGSNLNSSGPLSINSGEIFGSSNLTLQTYNAGKLIINSSNLYSNGTNFGIGTTNPLTPLHVGTTASATVGGQTLSSLSGLFTGSLAAPRYYDSDTSLYFIDPAVGVTTGNAVSLASQGSIKFNVNDTTASNTYINSAIASRIQNFTNGLSLDVGTTATAGANITWNNNLFLTSSGNVGIGTTNPNSLLSLLGVSKDPSTNGILNIDTNDIGVTNVGIKIGAISGIGSSGFSYIQSKHTGIANDANLILNPLGGNVGIGTTDPRATLHINGNPAPDGLPASFMVSHPNDSTKVIQLGFDPSGNYGSISAVDINTGWKNIAINASGGSVGIGTTNPGYKLDVIGSLPMRILNPGTATGLEIGTGTTSNQIAYLDLTSDTTNTDYGARLLRSGETNGFVQLSNVGTGVIIVQANTNGVYLASGATSWSAYSDLRLKNITNNFSNALEDINQLNPVHFTWKSDSTNTPQVGLIAQDVQKVLPEAISVDANGFLGVRYTELIPLLTAGIKELNAKVENLKQDLSITATGQININYNISPEVLASLGYSDSKNEIESTTYSLTDSFGNTVTRISQFAEIAVGKIKAGLISTTNLIADNAAIKNLKTKNLTSEKLETDNLISPVGNITHLTSQDIQTTQVTTDNLVAQNIQTTEVVTNDLTANNIQTDQLNSDKITANEASVSTLYADQIISKEGSFADIMANKISSLRQELTNIVAKNEESTPSAIALESDKWSINVATDSATISGDLALTDNLVIGAQLLVNGDAQFGNAFVTGQFTAGEVSIASNYIETTNTALFIQPSNTGSVHIMGETLVIADNGEVKINGNLTVTGSVFANLLDAAEIRTQKLTAAEINSDKINIATDSGTILGATDTNIATNSGTLIANSASTDEALAQAVQINSNATAGTATLPIGKTELIVSTTKLTANSMVYLTPVGSTSNQVLYVKEKTADHFTVALDQPLDHDVNINWWIIN